MLSAISLVMLFNKLAKVQHTNVKVHSPPSVSRLCLLSRMEKNFTSYYLWRNCSLVGEENCFWYFIWTSWKLKGWWKEREARDLKWLMKKGYGGRDKIKKWKGQIKVLKRHPSWTDQIRCHIKNVITDMYVDVWGKTTQTDRRINEKNRSIWSVATLPNWVQGAVRKKEPCVRQTFTQKAFIHLVHSAYLHSY